MKDDEKMIRTEEGFQYSVNIAYDLHNSEKLKGFIPTSSSLELLEKILLSTKNDSTDRARILIGAYGKGKSHIVLAILSLLAKEKRENFVHLNEKLESERYKNLKILLENYYEGKTKLLPVLISGTGTSLSQSFILSLKRTLDENDLSYLMPDTNYKAAVRAIEKWRSDFPETFRAFCQKIDMPPEDFISSLEDFDISSYRIFEEIYPLLTAGSSFNPFLGFDVTELYESVAKELRRKTDWTGMYVVYDEFSKYLESNITSASVSDTKMLQDFAEKSCRSAENQLHLMLISHKEISNYIDTLPKQKVDGWRGISERFEHVVLSNNFSEIYEIIGTVIQKNPGKWGEFCKKHDKNFKILFDEYKNHALFSELSESDFEKTALSCYPLHPVSMFILPRLSERVAQNERTLFTFLSAHGKNTLSAFLESLTEEKFFLLTPDILFDYFEPLLKKEVYSAEIHDSYILASEILGKFEGEGEKASLEAKIIKTISLFYILSQFEKIAPVQEEIVRIYGLAYGTEKIESALKNLIQKEFVVYQKQSNGYLCLKKSSGIDVAKSIEDEIEREKNSIVLKNVLNGFDFEKYFYPSRYNDEKEMTRFFKFVFIDESEVQTDTDWNLKSSHIHADGVIYGILPHSDDSIKILAENLKKTSAFQKRFVFVLPKRLREIKKTALSYSAIKNLQEKVAGDEILFEEYQVALDDAKEILSDFVSEFTRPENFSSLYVSDGKILPIKRKAELSSVLSEICENVFPNSPVIKNESLNKDEITKVMLNARMKVLASLLRSELEERLGLLGNGPDVFIMRSALVSTGILCKGEEKEGVHLNLNLSENDDKSRVMPLISEINSFVKKAKEEGSAVSFSELYEKLRSPEFGIGARSGIIPIFLAAVFRSHKKEISVQENGRKFPLSAQILNEINENPKNFSLVFSEWNSEKESFVKNLKNLFADFVPHEDSVGNLAQNAHEAIQKWYMSLPKFSKEAEKIPEGSGIPKEYRQFLKLIKDDYAAEDFLFEKLPVLFGKENLFEKVSEAKKFYDGLLSLLEKWAKEKIASVFGDLGAWKKSLSKNVFEQVFTDGTERFLKALNDENDFNLSKIVLAATDLRLENWGERTLPIFETRLLEYKNTAESFGKETSGKSHSENYELAFVNENGVREVKRFEKVENSVRGKLLRNRITDALSAMGQAVETSEKRQILLEILRELC